MATVTAVVSAPKVFYIIRRTTALFNKYVRQATSGDTRGFSGDDRITPHTLRFNSVLAAAQRINERNAAYRELASDAFEIVRVEEITTVGTKRRIEVPLGDKRQTGVAIKHTGAPPNYVVGLEMGSPHASWQAGIEGARVYYSQSEAWLALQKYIQGSRGIVLGGPPSFVGIAEETIPGTTTYNETVLA